MGSSRTVVRDIGQQAHDHEFRGAVPNAARASATTADGTTWQMLPSSWRHFFGRKRSAIAATREPVVVKGRFRSKRVVVGGGRAAIHTRGHRVRKLKRAVLPSGLAPQIRKGLLVRPTIGSNPPILTRSESKATGGTPVALWRLRLPVSGRCPGSDSHRHPTAAARAPSDGVAAKAFSNANAEGVSTIVARADGRPEQDLRRRHTGQAPRKRSSPEAKRQAPSWSWSTCSLLFLGGVVTTMLGR